MKQFIDCHGRHFGGERHNRWAWVWIVWHITCSAASFKQLRIAPQTVNENLFIVDETATALAGIARLDNSHATIKDIVPVVIVGFDQQTEIDDSYHRSRS